MKKFFGKVFDIIFGIIVVAGVLMAVISVGRALQPLALIITMLVVLFFTIATFEKWMTAFLAIGGIVFYVISWYLVNSCGDMSAQMLCYSGILMWFAGVFGSFTKDSKITQSSSI